MAAQKNSTTSPKTSNAYDGDGTDVEGNKKAAAEVPNEIITNHSKHESPRVQKTENEFRGPAAATNPKGFALPARVWPLNPFSRRWS